MAATVTKRAVRRWRGTPVSFLTASSSCLRSWHGHLHSGPHTHRVDHPMHPLPTLYRPRQPSRPVALEIECAFLIAFASQVSPSSITSGTSGNSSIVRMRMSEIRLTVAASSSLLCRLRVASTNSRSHGYSNAPMRSRCNAVRVCMAPHPCARNPSISCLANGVFSAVPWISTN